MYFHKLKLCGKIGKKTRIYIYLVGYWSLDTNPHWGIDSEPSDVFRVDHSVVIHRSHHQVYRHYVFDTSVHFPQFFCKCILVWKIHVSHENKDKKLKLKPTETKYCLAYFLYPIHT